MPPSRVALYSGFGFFMAMSVFAMSYFVLYGKTTPSYSEQEIGATDTDASFLEPFFADPYAN